MPPKSRQDPRKELLSQIRDIRSRIDPDVLERAERAAQAADAAREQAQGNPGAVPFDAVPFDKDNARAGVMMFLQGRGDGGALARKVMTEMKKPESEIQFDGGARPTAKPATPAKPPAKAAKKPEPKPGLFKRLFS